MTTQHKDRVNELTTTTGTGAYTLGGATLGYNTALAAGCLPGEVYGYFVEGVEANGALTGVFEVGTGTYTAGLLTSLSVTASSNAGLKINWATGNKRIGLALIAATLDGFGAGGAAVDLTAAPVSTPQAAALALKADKTNTYTKAEVTAAIQVAHDTAITSVTGVAPTTLDTIAELAAFALSDNSGLTALVEVVATKAGANVLDAEILRATAAENLRALKSETYTKAQVDSMTLGGGGGVVTWGALDGIPAVLQAPANLVVTSDPRLGDARNPTSHDHAIGSITGLTDALLAKATSLALTAETERATAAEGAAKSEAMSAAAIDATNKANAAAAAAEAASTPVAHATNSLNPHSVTKDQVGLSSADNTADTAKPVSTAQAAADTAILNSAKTYADSLVLGLWDDRGSFAATTNAYPATGGSGASNAIIKGDIWTVSVVATSGPLLGVPVGSTVRATADTPGQTASKWSITSAGIGYIAENATAKDSSGGYAGLTGFALNLLNATGAVKSFFTSVATSARTWTMPDKSGTVAMLSDLPIAASTTPAALGAAAIGVSTTFARGDHVHDTLPNATITTPGMMTAAQVVLLNNAQPALPAGSVDMQVWTNHPNGTSSWQLPTPGIDGKNGITPVLGIGTITTRAPGLPATATLSGPPEAPLLNINLAAQQALPNTDLITPTEPIVINRTAGASGQLDVNIGECAMFYWMLPSAANFTINVRSTAAQTLDALMLEDKVKACVVLVRNGAVPFYCNTIKIDGVLHDVMPAIQWDSGSMPTGGNALAIDSYTLTIIKTGPATFQVLAGQTLWKK